MPPVQKPAQQSEVVAHVAPAARHVLDRQLELTQRAEQQFAARVQNTPGPLHAGARQAPAEHVSPAQQSVASVHAVPVV